MMLTVPFITMAKTELPSHVVNIEKQNNFTNVDEGESKVEPNKEVKNLLEDTEEQIENPVLIKLLNETSIKPTPFSFGYRGSVFLGRWPLSYKSKEKEISWQFQKINQNELNNVSGDKTGTLFYNQLEEKKVTGGLATKVDNPDQIKQLMLAKAREKGELPMAFSYTLGKDTKLSNTYDVPVKKNGILSAYASAVNEKGEVRYGDVYVELKGTKKNLEIKNVTTDKVAAWIVIPDHLSFSFELK